MITILLSISSFQAQNPALFFWADAFFKASLVVLLALLFHWIYRRHPASSHGLIWLIAITSCLCIPLFKLFIPTLDLVFLIQQPELLTDSGSDSATTGSGLDLYTTARNLFLPVLGLTYVTGLVVMLTNLAISILRLFNLSNKARSNLDHPFDSTLQKLLQSHGITARVTLLVSSQIATPYTWGIFRHQLVLPASATLWNQQLLEQAIGHELGHIQRNDWIYQLLGRITLCIYWPNPLLWLATRMLKIASERASDDTAADCSGSDINYATNLIQLASCIRSREPNPQLAMGLFSRSSILTLRIRHLLTTDRNRSLLRSDELLAVTLMSLLLIVPFSSLKFTASFIDSTPDRNDYISLNVDPQTDETTFHADTEQKAISPPERLSFDKTVPDFHEGVPERIKRIALSTYAMPVDLKSHFELAAAEFFQQWEPTPLLTPAPDYPLSARRRGIEGYVVAEYDLDDKGNTINPRIIESVPTGTFDSAVLRAVENFVYCSEIANGIGGNNQSIRKRFSFALQD